MRSTSIHDMVVTRASLSLKPSMAPCRLRSGRSPVAAAITFCFGTAPVLPMPGADYQRASTLGAMAATSWPHRAFIRCGS
jgi:hypothetical protein